LLVGWRRWNTFHCGKVDLGTGALTAPTQIAAEELDLPIDHITISTAILRYLQTAA
jgi:CO/xanthine dehydrogenase Mo-binding subunit